MRPVKDGVVISVVVVLFLLPEEAQRVENPAEVPIT